MKTIKACLVFKNGNVAVVDEQGAQIPELQLNVYLEWARIADQRGFDPTGVVIQSPGGDLRITKTSIGLWSIEPV